MELERRLLLSSFRDVRHGRGTRRNGIQATVDNRRTEGGGTAGVVCEDTSVATQLGYALGIELDVLIDGACV
jgi:hypothetical protein